MEYMVLRLPLLPPLTWSCCPPLLLGDSHSTFLKNGSIPCRRRNLPRIFSSFITMPCHSSQVSLHSSSKAPAVPAIYPPLRSFVF
jgi:hypothetical protein